MFSSFSYVPLTCHVLRFTLAISISQTWIRIENVLSPIVSYLWLTYVNEEKLNDRNILLWTLIFIEACFYYISFTFLYLINTVFNNQILATRVSCFNILVIVYFETNVRSEKIMFIPRKSVSCISVADCLKYIAKVKLLKHYKDINYCSLVLYLRKITKLYNTLNTKRYKT